MKKQKTKTHEILIPKESMLPVLTEQVQKQIEEELLKLGNEMIVDVNSLEWVDEGIKVSFTTK